MPASLSDRLKSPLPWLILTLAALAVLTSIGPAEKTLGANARIVYLHGAWVWASLAAFVASGLAGLAGLLTRRAAFHGWSRALGRSGLVFWISYLPISLWAMQANWNGLFLAEPRFRVAIIFAIGGLLMQVGLALIDDPAWAAAANLLYILILMYVLGITPNIMHPPAPILNSDARRIQLFFAGLLTLTVLAAWLVTLGWHQFEGNPKA